MLRNGLTTELGKTRRKIMESTLNGLSVTVQILFSPFAGAAGLNLIAIGVYLSIAALAICAYLEYGKD